VSTVMVDISALFLFDGLILQTCFNDDDANRYIIAVDWLTPDARELIMGGGNALRVFSRSRRQLEIQLGSS